LISVEKKERDPRGWWKKADRDQLCGKALPNLEQVVLSKEKGSTRGRKSSVFVKKTSVRLARKRPSSKRENEQKKMSVEKGSPSVLRRKENRLRPFLKGRE